MTSTPTVVIGRIQPVDGTLIVLEVVDGLSYEAVSGRLEAWLEKTGG